MDKGRAIQVYKYVYQLVKETPNDQDLGEKIREHYKKLECDCDNKTHVIDTNCFPYGDNVEYDLCVDCGEKYNFKII